MVLPAEDSCVGHSLCPDIFLSADKFVYSPPIILQSELKRLLPEGKDQVTVSLKCFHRLCHSVASHEVSPPLHLIL